MVRNKLVGNGVINQVESVLLARYGLTFSAREREAIQAGGRTVLGAIVSRKSCRELSVTDDGEVTQAQNCRR